MKNKVYIAGKITGDPNYREKFAKAEEELRSQGYTAIMNPAILPESEYFTWEDYMEVTGAMLYVCDTIYMLADWKDSKGAKMELSAAERREYTILYQNPVETQNTP